MGKESFMFILLFGCGAKWQMTSTDVNSGD